jgi:hypothetical protein
MKKILLSAFAVFGMLASQAQSTVVNYSFENTLASGGSGSALTHSSGNAVFSDNARTGNGVYSVSLNGSEYLSGDFTVPTGLTGYTINYWVKLGSKPNYNVGATNVKLVELQGSPQEYSGSFVTATNPERKPYFEVFVSTNNAFLYTAPDTLDSDWHMLTFKWVTDTAYIYVDGIQTLKESSASTFIASNEKLAVGALLNNLQGVPGYQSSLGGDIDEIRIYETGLSDASILSLYNTGEIISGINGVAADIKVGMYPNPANEFLIITCDEEIETTEVYNVVGEKVIFVKGQITKLNTAPLAQGMYSVQLKTTNGNTAVKKFIKQ